MSIRDSYRRWRAFGQVASMLLPEVKAQAGVALSTSVFAVALVCVFTPVGDLHPIWMIALAITLIAAGTVAMAWIASPFWGMHYLRQIEADTGPKTRERVLAWFMAGHHRNEEQSLNIELMAQECGEGLTPFERGRK